MRQSYTLLFPTPQARPTRKQNCAVLVGLGLERATVGPERFYFALDSLRQGAGKWGVVVEGGGGLTISDRPEKKPGECPFLLFVGVVASN